MKRYLKNKSFLTGAILAFIMLGMLVVSLFWLPYDPEEMYLAPKLSLPSISHLMGTDQFGRDVMSRIMKGIQVSFGIGVVVVAAGNDGPAPYTITSPGTSRKVITVGTGKEAGGDYSGQGPVPGTCVCKPDIIAPAINILSCDNHGKNYKKRSGTSMATPIVSGTVALLLSNEPWLSNRDVKIRLMQSALDCGMAKSRQGWGLLNPEGILRI